MRDGKNLSAYLYTPVRDRGQLPAIFEQRYADLTGLGTRKAAADLARAGFAVAMVNYRGTHESEGTWVGYRTMQWGPLRDGYDVCEWLAQQLGARERSAPSAARRAAMRRTTWPSPSPLT
nr:CocE/NonD family hydrolase [Verrucomicrobium spinosum]